MASWMENDLLELLSPHMIKENPNTYSYTKCLSEDLATEYAKRIPVAIARPSIGNICQPDGNKINHSFLVTPIWKEPIPGWHDNLNGPTGMLVAAAKGVLRTMHCDAEAQSESIPVDVATNSVILTAWKLANSPKSDQPFVVNISPNRVRNSSSTLLTFNCFLKHAQACEHRIYIVCYTCNIRPRIHLFLPSRYARNNVNGQKWSFSNT